MSPTAKYSVELPVGGLIVVGSPSWKSTCTDTKVEVVLTSCVSLVGGVRSVLARVTGLKS